MIVTNTIYALGSAGFVAEIIRLLQLRYCHNACELEMTKKELLVAMFVASFLSTVPIFGWAISNNSTTLSSCYKFVASLYLLLGIQSTAKLLKLRKVLLTVRLYPTKNLDDIVILSARVLMYIFFMYGVFGDINFLSPAKDQIPQFQTMFISLMMDIILIMNRYLMGKLIVCSVNYRKESDKVRFCCILKSK